MCCISPILGGQWQLSEHVGHTSLGGRKKEGRCKIFRDPPLTCRSAADRSFGRTLPFTFPLLCTLLQILKDFLWIFLSRDRWPGQSVTLPQLYIPDVPPRTSTEVKIFLVLYAWENRSAKLFAELLNNMTALTEIRSLKYVWMSSFKLYKISEE